MDVYEIIKKDHLDQNEMEYVVEQYIKIKKGRDIKINVRANPILSMIPLQFQQQIIQNELSMLNEAYDVAMGYFINNPPPETEENKVS